jgi:mitochondrial fission protein ELM1
VAEPAPPARGLGHLPEPRVAVLVGGPSRSARFGAKALDRLCEALSRLAVEGIGLIVVPSRRTPPEAVERLADLLSGLGGWIWGGRGDNPYPAALGLAEAALVTADSVNMASEAASVGLPVHVLHLDRIDDKLTRFHAELVAHGAARPFAGELERWAYEPLRETERVAEAVARLFRGAPAPWPQDGQRLDSGL